MAKKRVLRQKNPVGLHFSGTSMDIIFLDKFKFLGKLLTYPSPKLTVTLTSHLGQNDGLGEG